MHYAYTLGFGGRIGTDEPKVLWQVSRLPSRPFLGRATREAVAYIRAPVFKGEEMCR